jgi:hypothetical protein
MITNGWNTAGNFFSILENMNTVRPCIWTDFATRAQFIAEKFASLCRQLACVFVEGKVVPLINEAPHRDYVHGQLEVAYILNTGWTWVVSCWLKSRLLYPRVTAFDIHQTGDCGSQSQFRCDGSNRHPLLSEIETRFGIPTALPHPRGGLIVK